MCAQLDSLCFESEVFDEFMIKSLLSTPYVRGFLLLKNEAPIGYSLYSHSGDEGDLLTISVLPEHQGHGYGEQLFKKIINDALKHNLKKILLEVRPSNKKALALYEKHGGEQVGIRKNYYSVAGSTTKEDAIVIVIKLKAFK